ncbi:hypothetical protein KY389_12685 [Paracoccus bogoriensis]|uniref:head-tail joining protein n=1 Tax=Paracoccus bogoriensis TaxID=242065 RepID=UPI001CA4B409|nr:hypothetical protein [Paracoccus bogoriensis]
MTAFAAAVDIIFADPNLALPAVWHPGGAGPGQPVQVIRQRPDRIAGFGESRFVTDTVVLQLRISDAPTLAQGDLIEIAGEPFEILGEPLRDGERLIWSAEARVQP